VPLLAGGINFQVVHSGLGLTPSFLQRLCEILAFILTVISACRCMSSDLSRAALQSYVSYAAFDDLSRHLCISRWLLVALVLSRLDYGNATLAGLPTSLLNRLQSVINAAARSIAGLRRSEHITDALASFHWLRAPKRIKFKLAVLVYRALRGTAPQYLSGQLQYVADLPSRRRGRLRTSTSSLLDVRPS